MKTFISFLIFCLIATCNAEIRTWTAVNGKEVEAEFVSNEKGIVKLKLKSGKVFEVPANKLSKEDNEFITSLAKPEGVNWSATETREGIIYLKGSDTPYTGKVFRLYKNGHKRGELTTKNGKRDGFYQDWHENGMKCYEGNFKDGGKDGLWVQWHENGQKAGEEIYKDGTTDGHPVLRWHENGQKSTEYKIEFGKKIYEKYWNRKGESVSSYQEALK